MPSGKVYKYGDNVDTDVIIPARYLNAPSPDELAKHCMEDIDATFAQKVQPGDIIVGGANYGQGSSREHAALAPLYLGIKAVIVKSFARIHRSNLINAGILPCTFKNEADYDLIDEGDLLSLSGLKDAVESGSLDLIDKTKGITVPLSLDLSDRAKNIITAGGLLNFTKENF